MRTATLIRSCPVPLAQDPYYVHAMLAAHLAPGTIFSHRSAAVIWRLALARSDAIEVTTPAGVNGVPNHPRQSGRGHRAPLHRPDR